MDSDVPDSLRIVCDSRHGEAIEEWWQSLSDEDRSEFLAIANLPSESLGNQVDQGNEEEEMNDGTDDWYEYIVNHDVRFYLDRSDPQGNYNLVDSVIAPLDAASDAFELRHLHRNPDK